MYCLPGDINYHSHRGRKQSSPDPRVVRSTACTALSPSPVGAGTALSSPQLPKKASATRHGCSRRLSEPHTCLSGLCISLPSLKLPLPIAPLQRLCLCLYIACRSTQWLQQGKSRPCKHQSKTPSTSDSTTKTSAADAMPTPVPLLTCVRVSGGSSRSWSRRCVTPGTYPSSCSRDRVSCKEKPQALNPLEPPRRSTQGHSQQGRNLVPPSPSRADMGISAGVSQTDHQTSSW